tara:strand:+ start:307 stop:903 length:597 start_codon:yes stop_codon:yes gene_type:complete
MKFIFNAFSFMFFFAASTYGFGADNFLSFNLNLGYQQSSEDDGSVKEDTDESHASFHGGIYIFGGLLAGVTHYQGTKNVSESTDVSTTVTNTTTTSATLSGTGLFAGYHADNGFMISAAYLLLEPKYKTSGLLYYGGGALVADVGYRIEFGSGFGIGGILEYYEFTFKKSKQAGVASDLAEDLKWNAIKPAVAAFLFF